MDETDKDMEELVRNEGKATPEQFALTATYNILVTNELMIAQVYEAIYHIKHSDQYKQKVKQMTNQLEKMRINQEKKLEEVAGHRIAFLSDVAQIVQDECQVNIDQLIEAITEEFAKINHPYPRLMAQVELARTFSELSIINLDLRYKELVERNVPEPKHIQWLRNEEFLRVTTRLSELLFKGGVVNLNKNPMCKTALRMLETKLTDVKLIARSISESNKLNPAKDLIE